jgi:hypothetical protein
LILFDILKIGWNSNTDILEFQPILLMY